MPKLTPRDDIAQLRWVKASEISHNGDVGAQPEASKLSRYHVRDEEGAWTPIRDLYGKKIDQAVALAYKEALSRQGIAPPELRASVGLAAKAIYDAYRDKAASVNPILVRPSWAERINSGQLAPSSSLAL